MSKVKLIPESKISLNFSLILSLVLSAHKPSLWAGPFGQILNYFPEFSKKTWAGLYIFLRMFLLLQLFMTLWLSLLLSFPDGLIPTPPMGWSSWINFITIFRVQQTDLNWIYISLMMSPLLHLVLTLQPLLLACLPDGLHPTPPMGWSSWNSFFSYNSEEKMMAQVLWPCPIRLFKIEIQKLWRKFHPLWTN